MKNTLSRWFTVQNSLPRLRKLSVVAAPLYPKASALILVTLYVALALAAYSSMLQQRSLAIKIGLCDETPCVLSVTPGGLGWFYGAEREMTVISVNGQPLTNRDIEVFARENMAEVVFLGDDGKAVDARLPTDASVRNPIGFSVWILGGIFALLGSSVILRRPDLHTARMFWLFCGMTSLALAVSPSSGAGVAWARILLGITLVGIGASIVLFVLALTTNHEGLRRHIIANIYLGIGVFIIVSFGASLFVEPALFQLVRPGVPLYLAAAVLSSIGLLAVSGARQASPAVGQQARIVLFGIAAGSLPVLGFTIIPRTLGYDSLLPIHFTILALGIIPAAFTYAILQHQLLGIRRLVHRGMVYGLSTFVLLMLIALALTLVQFGSQATGPGVSPLAVAAILVGGVLLFFLLRRAARWLVDNFVYRDVVDYRSALQLFHRDLPIPEKAPEVATLVADRLADMLGLEAVLVFLGNEPATSQLIAAGGRRTDDMLHQIHPQLATHIDDSKAKDLAELRWQSESLLLANLRLSGTYLGYILLGPKEGGEVFVEEEKQLVATVAPLVALAIDKSELSEDLRGV